MFDQIYIKNTNNVMPNEHMMKNTVYGVDTDLVS